MSEMSECEVLCCCLYVCCEVLNTPTSSWGPCWCSSSRRTSSSSVDEYSSGFRSQFRCDEGYEEGELAQGQERQSKLLAIFANPCLDVPNPGVGTEFKRGSVFLKSCLGPGGKKPPKAECQWNMYFAVIRDLIIYFYKDEESCEKQIIPPRNETTKKDLKLEQQVSLENVQRMVHVHHALARPAKEYEERQHVIRLFCVDQSEFLIQASFPTQMQSWMDSLNFAAAQLSTQPCYNLSAKSPRWFQRPLFPAILSNISMREQLRSYDYRVGILETELDEIRSQSHKTQNKREAFLQYEVIRYKFYIDLLSEKIMPGGDPVGIVTKPPKSQTKYAAKSKETLV